MPYFPVIPTFFVRFVCRYDTAISTTAIYVRTERTNHLEELRWWLRTDSDWSIVSAAFDRG